MATLLEKLSDILEKGGVNTEQIKGFILANQDLSKVILSTEIETGIDSLMSADAAVAHPEVRKKLQVDFLKGIDNTLADRIPKYLDVETANAIKAEKSTYKRLELFADKMEELKKEATKAKKEANPDEVKRLNDEMAALKDGWKIAEAKFKADAEAIRNEYHDKEKHRSLKSWVKDQKLVRHILDDPDGAELVRIKLERELQKYPGVTYDIDANGNLTLGKKSDNGLEKYYDPITNKELNWADFTGKVMAEQKLLAVSEPPPANPPIVNIGNGTATVQPRAFSVQPQQG